MIEEKLPHLPQSKQRMVMLMLNTILSAFQEQFAPKHGRSIKDAKIVKIILFGSHARGGYVNDYGSGYHSDYDFCILVNNARFKNRKYWFAVENALKSIPHFSETDHSSPGLVIHSYREMNAKLKDGWPFYIDIVKDGITLYELEGYELAPIGPMKQDRRKKMAEKWFHQEIKETDKHLLRYNLSRKESVELNNLAAFDLHQATESLYRCLLMTLTLYAPKLHDLVKLHERAVKLAPELKDVWPMNDRKAKQAFELLVSAYVNARYSPHYKISNEQLDWLEERIKILREKVIVTCEEYLATPHAS